MSFWPKHFSPSTPAWHWRRTSALILAGLMLLVLAAPVFAEGEAPLALKVTAGYDGQAKFGLWLPVSVDVSNDGPDVSAQLVTRVWWDQGNPNAPLTEYVKDIELPRGARKRVTLFVPAAMDKLTVTLNGPRGNVLAESTETLTAIQGALAGVLADTPDVARFLSGVNLGQVNRPWPVTVVRLDSDRIPTVSAALGALDVLVLSSTAPEKLTSDQWRAVEGWVAQGGVLVLGGGSQAGQVLGAVPESLRPVQVTGTVTLTQVDALASLLPTGSQAGAPPAGKYVAAAGSLQQGKALAEENGVPLLAEREYGQGTVYYSALDLAGEPLITWSGSPGLWETLLRRAGLGLTSTAGAFGGAQPTGPYRGSYPPGSPGRFAPQLAYAVRNMPSLEVPSLRALALLLLGYALLAGPLTYFLLRKLDRRDWSWLVIPTLALIVAGTVYSVGFAGKGKDVFTNTLAVVRLAPGQRTVPVTSWVGVFAPSRNHYTVEIPGQSLVSGGLENGYYGPGPAATNPAKPIGMRVAEGSGSQVELLDYNVWTIRTYAVDTDITVSGTVEGRLTARPTTTSSGINAYSLEGTVTNSLPFDLEDVTVLAGFAYQRVGDIPAGASKTVQITSVAGQTAQTGAPWMYQIYQPGPPQPGMPPGAAQDITRKQQVLTTAFETEGGLLPYPITLIGWTKSPISDVGLQSRPGRDSSLTLVVAPLELVQAPGLISLPPGMVQARVIDSQNLRGGAAGPGRYFLESGSLTFALEPKLPVGTTVNHMAVLMGTRNGPLTVEFWNWQRQEWQPGTVAGTDAYSPGGPLEAFLGPDGGTVRVRVSNSGQPADFDNPSLMLAGEVKAK